MVQNVPAEYLPVGTKEQCNSNTIRKKAMLSIKIKVNKGIHKAILQKGRPLGDCPKTYKKLRTVFHNIGGTYNSDLLTIFLAKDKTFRYEIYRDGCFYPYYGKITFEDLTLKDLTK